MDLYLHLYSILTCVCVSKCRLNTHTFFPQNHLLATECSEVLMHQHWINASQEALGKFP